MDASAVEGAVVAATISESSEAASPEPEQEPTILLEEWFVKKAPHARHANKKRYFVLYSNGVIRYYAAVSPDGEKVSEKGNFRIFQDTLISTTDAGKKGVGCVLLVSSLDKCGLKDREWHLTAESAGTVTKWEKALKDLTTNLAGLTKDFRADMEARKAVEGSVMKKLGGKVAGTLASARSTMTSFGFSGSVTVSGSLLGMSVSMGLEVEVEEGEGEMEVKPGEAGGEENDMEEDASTKQDDDEDYDPAADIDQEDSPAKESAFKRGVKGGMKKAMGKVKILAFEMKKYRLTGTIGVGFDVTMFGTGIEVEFEINLTSCITDTEFEEMLAHEKEIKAAKKEKKELKKGRKSGAQLQTSRRDSAAVGGQ